MRDRRLTSLIHNIARLWYLAFVAHAEQCGLFGLDEYGDAGEGKDAFINAAEAWISDPEYAVSFVTPWVNDGRKWSAADRDRSQHAVETQPASDTYKIMALTLCFASIRGTKSDAVSREILRQRLWTLENRDGYGLEDCVTASVPNEDEDKVDPPFAKPPRVDDLDAPGNSPVKDGPRERLIGEPIVAAPLDLSDETIGKLATALSDAIERVLSKPPILFTSNMELDGEGIARAVAAAGATTGRTSSSSPNTSTPPRSEADPTTGPNYPHPKTRP